MLAAFLCGATLVVVAVQTTGSGHIKEFDGVQVAPPDSACTTNADTFEPIPGVSLSFSVPFGVLDGNGPTQVVLMFQGQFGGFTSTPGSRVILQLQVDGHVAGSAVAIANDTGTGVQTFGFNSFTPITHGNHTAEALWHTFPAGGESCVEERSLIVLHQ
jgi:hypothetical protein